MIADRNRISIHNQIFYSILLFLIIPFILSFYFFDKPLERSIETRIGSSVQEALVMAGMNLEYVLEDMYNSSVNVSTLPEVARMLKDPGAFSKYDQLQLKQQTMRTWYNYTAYIAIMDLHNFLFTSRYTEESMFKHFQSTDWYQQLLKHPNKSIWLFDLINYTFADKKPIISLARTVVDPQTKQRLGVILFSAAEEDFGKYLSELEGAVYLVDTSGIVISSSDKAQLGRKLPDSLLLTPSKSQGRGPTTIKQDGESLLVNFYTLNHSNWKIVQVIPYNQVYNEIFDIRKGKMVMTSVIVAIFMIITLFISYGISRPLTMLGKKMREAERKQFRNYLSMKGPKEISILIASYNHMLEQIKELLQRVKEQYKQKEDMRFRALQAQIKPHFILNTLNNIKWMAYIQKNHEIGQMLSRLAGILEGSLGANGSVVTLQQEISYLEDYVALMKMKYNEKLTVVYDIPSDLMGVEVIKFMLQPAVENSIYHGVEPLKGKGIVRIRVTSEFDVLQIIVSDNGVGMDDRKLQEVRKRLCGEAEQEFSHESIGIKNVHDRLRLQYGDRYGIVLDSAPHRGTTVKYLLPRKVHPEGVRHA